MKLSVLVLALACIALGEKTHHHQDKHSEQTKPRKPEEKADKEHGDDRHHYQRHHSFHKFHIDRHERIKALDRACKDDMENYCSSADIENLIDFFACGYNHKEHLSSSCLATAEVYFPALFYCAGDVSRSCPMVGQWHQLDMHSEWHESEGAGHLDASVRCIEAAKPSFSTACAAAIKTDWSYRSAELGIEESTNPNSLDIYRMFSPGIQENHAFAWAGAIIGIALSGIFMLLAVCCCAAKRRVCSRRGCCSRGPEAEIPVASPAVDLEGTPYPPPVATPVTVHVQNSTALSALSKTALSVLGVELPSVHSAWNCSQCTLKNDAQKDACEACGCQRSAGNVAAAPIIPVPVATHVPVYPASSKPADFSYNRLH